MKKERFIVVATSDAEHHFTFEVMAECHCLYTWKETELQGVSKAGRKKLDRLSRMGYALYAYNVTNQPKIIGWRD